MASPGRWHTVEAIFQQALDLPGSERDRFLEEACGLDGTLLADVRSLLAQCDAQTTRLESAVRPVASDLFRFDGPSEEPPPRGLPDHYRIERRVGAGGMGTVYQAVDTRLGRSVAVKFLAPKLANAPDSRSRFLREARCAAALSHPNIAVVHDIGDTGETAWIVMEYVSGTTLRSRLMAGPLPAPALLRYGIQVADALEHAHARRIVHRDLKPENVLVDNDDRVKVVDFGLARAFGETADERDSITQPSVFVGTLRYAAPELFAPGSASARSDVYSFGVMLAEMACGDHPYARLSGPALVAAIVSGEPAFRADAHPELQNGLAALIERCIARQAALRYADGAELAAALRAVGSGTEIESAAPSAPCVAVFDFTNVGGASEAEWFGTGIAETLTADLAKLKAVRIASRARVQQVRGRFGDPSKDEGAARALGRELGARWIVTGGVQRAGDTVRVTPLLIDTERGEVIPAGKIDGRWSSVFELQDRVVESLLNSIEVRFGTTDQHRIIPAETRNLMAYEHYVRGRGEMYRMKPDSLDRAMSHLEQAIGLDPNYALAYSALGTCLALRFIRTSNPEDVIRCSTHLERAIELDPELGEPYTWLANIRVRRNDPAGAVAAGMKAVEMQPDIAESHYFYAGLCYMIAETRLGDLRRAPQHMLEAIRLQPRMHASWIVLGALAIFVGKYNEAIQVLTRALRLSTTDDLLYRFEGAHTLLAIAHTRCADWEQARRWHTQALDVLRDSQHIYGPTFRILSACGLGDLELLSGNFQQALAYYRQARRIVRESPRIAGSARLLARATAGLAAGYGAAGDLSRGRELLDEAASQVKACVGQTVSVTFECGLAHLFLTVAAAEVRLGSNDAAAGYIRRAQDAGWMDAAWLTTNPEFQPLLEHADFNAVVESLRVQDPIDIPLPPQLQTPGQS
jgi:TolB-like protein/tetratricopeptide (TPR) repeat protein